MISTADLVAWVRADDEDAPTLRSLEPAAILAIQRFTGRYFGVTATITEIIRFRGFPLTLANDPIGGALTLLEQWNGSAWTTVAASSYSVWNSFVFGEGNWSSLSITRFRATYQAGYTVDPRDADVWAAPDDIQLAVKLLVGNYFENREAVVTGTISTELDLGVQMLLAPYVRVTV